MVLAGLISICGLSVLGNLLRSRFPAQIYLPFLARPPRFAPAGVLLKGA